MTRTAPTRPRRRGVTLIELMIGLAIMAVLASLAVPSLGNYLQRQRLKSAAQGLETDLQEARYEAARRGTAVGVVFSTSGDWCYAIATTPDCDCRVQHACRLKTVRGSDLRGVLLLQATNPRFDPASGNTGQPGPAATWAISTGEQLRVNVSTLGRPSVCVAAGAMPGVAPC